MELQTEAPNVVDIHNGTYVGVAFSSLFRNITATGEPTNQIESHKYLSGQG